MAVDLLMLNKNQSLPPDLTVEHVTSVETLEHYIHAFTLGFDAPELLAKTFFDLYQSIGFDQTGAWHYYIGFLKGEPVACSTLFLGAGVAGIYNTATVPEARRQGIGTAMTLTSLFEAYEKGYSVGVLVSSQMGQRMYRRIGFKEYCKIGLYIR